MRNAQLWKRILNEGLVVDEGCAHPDSDALINHIITSPQIVAPRPIDLEAADDGLPELDDHLNICLPFPQFWIEGPLRCDRGDNMLWGAMIVTTHVSETEGFRFQAMLMQGCGLGPPAMEGMLELEIDKLGNVKPVERMPASFANWLCKQCEAENLEVQDVLRTSLRLCLSVLTILGCNNVSLEPREGDPKQVKRAIKRHGGDPSKYRYHVLVIRPPGAKSNTPAQEIGVMPYHRCRGHYQHYGLACEHRHKDGRDRGLLFGKYAGKFFVPPTYKGDKKNGVVEKDYELGTATIA